MTPDKWAAMQTAANQADSREWIVAVGWGALAVLLAAWCVLAVVSIGSLISTSRSASRSAAAGPMSEPIDTTDMRRAARAVYLATDAPVADELSRMLASAAREIDQLRTELATVRK